MCNRTDVRNGPALLLWLCLCDDSFLGREVVGFIHGQLFRCSRVVAPDLWSSRPDVSSRDDPLARRSRRAFFLRSVRVDASYPQSILHLETTKPPSRVFGTKAWSEVSEY